MKCLVEGCAFEFFEDDIDKREQMMWKHVDETGHNNWLAKWKWQK